MLVVLLASCGDGERRPSSAAAIAGWTAGEGEDTRPSSAVLARSRTDGREVIGDRAAPTDDAPRSHTLGGSRRAPIVRHGALVDVAFDGASLHDAMRVLAEVAGVDVVIDEGVQGTVTIDLRDVRALDAMEILATAHGASLEVSGRLVLVRAAR
ncbi:Type IV pilus biogenesis protein PilQ [Sandaracinus amylolyticus]|uniref:Type IV pilus biogenesis protein PilQ n=1 Tax=Sandaracinus amylolyticus TaxID=927083 RepID=A0A0F6W6H9_9BACT|nr:Type IV pilus biogenesis protein PilQ [Sandaracinus amylolyticus]